MAKNSIPRYSPEFLEQDLEYIIATFRGKGWTLGRINKLLEDAGYPAITAINSIPRL